MSPIEIYAFANSSAIGANKLNDTEIIFANGMKQEFEIAVERHNLIVPVGCTGYVAHEIWNTINQDMSAFYTNVDDSLIAAFTKLNTKSDNSSLVNDIISFIKLFKNGKYSPA